VRGNEGIASGRSMGEHGRSRVRAPPTLPKARDKLGQSEVKVRGAQSLLDGYARDGAPASFSMSSHSHTDLQIPPCWAVVGSLRPVHRAHRVTSTTGENIKRWLPLSNYTPATSM
jgi:hypothetical protein